jgi:SAM-dependent methyltransferase
MFEFHKDKKVYFDTQTKNCDEYVIPFIEKTCPISPEMNVLEVGSAEGGVLYSFYKRGCQCVGVELEQSRVDDANIFLEKEIQSGRIIFINKNIYDPSFEEEFAEKFDLIVLKDVIEHIHDQEKIMMQFRKFLKSDGHIFFGFPPFNMPYGGHQQVCQTKWLSVMPYIHLLPRSIYKWILDINREATDAYLEVVDTGISINRFEKIVKNTGYQIENKLFYLINPIYEYKFGIKPIVQFGLISKIPYLRDFVTTCVYYLVRK